MRKGNRKRKWKILLTVFLTGFVLTGCGGRSSSGSSDSVSTNMFEASEEAAYDSGWANDADETADFSASTVTEAEEENEPRAGSDTSETERKLIRTVNMDVETKEFDAFYADIEERVKALGGYIELSSVSGNSYYNSVSYAKYGSMTARIPSERLDEFVEGIEGEANVTNKSESTEDITLSYVDTESRVKALETEQERLLAMLEKAENVEDLISIESRLSEVRYDIESYSSRIRVYDNQVNYSTVYLNVREVTRETPAAQKTVLDRIRIGLGESVYQVAAGIVDFLVAVVIDLPYLVVLALVIFVIFLLLRMLYCRLRGKERRQLFRRKKKTPDEKNQDIKGECEKTGNETNGNEKE